MYQTTCHHSQKMVILISVRNTNLKCNHRHQLAYLIHPWCRYMRAITREIFCDNSGLVKILRLNLWRLRYCTSRNGRQFTYKHLWHVNISFTILARDGRNPNKTQVLDCPLVSQLLYSQSFCYHPFSVLTGWRMSRTFITQSLFEVLICTKFIMLTVPYQNATWNLSLPSVWSCKP
jgi:hypothetical protein